MGNKLIVITGLDGSGTSSLADGLSAKDPGSCVFKTPGPPFDHCRAQVDEQVRALSQPAHYLFYLSSVVFASTQIEKQLQQGNVYCVRYLIDTVVSHRAAGLDVDLDYDTQLYAIRRPDLTLMVQTAEQARQERISVRGKGFLDRLLDDDSLRNAFRREFDRLAGHYVTVTNDGPDIGSALRTAISHMPWMNKYV